MPLPRSRRARWIALAAGIVLLAAAAAAYLLLRDHRPGDVSNPGVEFAAPPPAETVPPERPARRPKEFRWPHYGYDKARTRFFPYGRRLRPPLKQIWALRGTVLLEFPPVLAGGSLYLQKNNGAIYAVSKRTGRVRWKRKLGDLAASSPAVGEGKVFAVVLRDKKRSGGRIVALSTRTGNVKWSRPLPSRAESSPLLHRGRLYFGSENGSFYALRARDGRVRWIYRAGGAIKGAPAYRDGVLYFGAYGGTVHAVKARDGKQRWKRSFGGGNFYSTPAVQFGRVYIGSTDGRFYSLSARTGALAWAKQTGGYVYASPAVGHVKGMGPTMFGGTYAGKFYALDARTGRVRWSYGHGGKLSGAPTVIGDVVWFSNLSQHSTTALGIRTGKRIWRRRRGAFNPVIADREQLYLTGYSSLFAFGPREKKG